MSNAYDFETMMSVPPSVLSQQDPVLSLGRDRAMQDAAAAAGRAQQDVDRERQMAQERATALRPLRQQQMESAAQPIPQPPRQQQPSKPPSAEDAQNQSWQQEWLTAAMFLGALAGGLTRRPLTNSLAAFTGMIEGYNEGNQQKFANSMKTWEAENKRVLEANESANKAYEQILKSRQLDQEQKLLMLQIEAAKHDDQAMAQAAITRDQIAVAQLHDQRLRYGQELRGAQNRRDEEQQQRAVQWVNSTEGQRRAQAIANYQLPAPTTFGRTSYQGALNQALMDKVLEINPDYNANKFASEKIRQTTPAAVDRSGQMAAARTLGTAGTNVQLVLSRAGPVLSNAAEAANKVPATIFPRLNEIFQKASSEIGDPDIRNFKVANEELAYLFAAVNNPRTSVVTFSAQEHARSLIAQAESPEAYQAILENIKRLAEREAAVVRGLQRGEQPEPITIPPIAPGRRSSVPEMLERTKGRAESGATEAFPNAQQAYERMHPHLPDWVPRLPEGWYLKLLPSGDQ